MSTLLEPKIAELSAAVAANTVESSRAATEATRAATLIQAFVDSGAATTVTPAQLQAISDVAASLSSSTGTLSAATDALIAALAIIPTPPTP